MKNLFNKMNVKIAVVFSGVMAMAQGAYAALPTWATDLGTNLTAAIDDVVAAVGPVVVAGLIAFITIKLIKRGANKI